MTLYIPLDAANDHPNSPPFLLPSSSPVAHLTTVIQSVLKAKRIAVVCGAGISVEAGIPDFRSQDGLFQTLRRDHPKESLSSGKDLFDASVFKSTQKTALFYRMIARLSSLSSEGQPTAFHQLLRTLDDRGQLLRVYTQNIDALEMKAGLSFGVPEFEEKKMRVKVKDSPEAGPSTPIRRTASFFPTMPITESRLNVIPRCIPLHGTLLTLHCQHCTQSFPLDPQTPLPVTSISPPPSPGTPPPCPSCTSLEQTRALVGKRLRGVGKLRPSVVLYGEDHREGEGVGEAVRRDLCGITGGAPVASEKVDAGHAPTKPRVRAGKGPDLLLVVGTSLRVPGTKRIVREFSKAVRPSASPASSRLPTPTPSPPAANSYPDQVRTVYLNLEFPLPSREWEGVFDVWVNGDVQEFAKAVTSVIESEEEERACKKQQAIAKRESAARQKTKTKPNNAASGKTMAKRKEDVPETPLRPSKRRKM
ncbi:DHS-like NAD/FAD-binding domain-containing protein, partial [Gautieria morchelliformis]